MGKFGTGQEGDSWILSRGLTCFNTRMRQVKPIKATTPHCLLAPGGTNPLSAAEPWTEN